MTIDLNIRGALTLCALTSSCLIIWILGAMWQEIQTATGSAAHIASPARPLWFMQHCLAVLLLQFSPRLMLVMGFAIVSASLPIWLLLNLIEILDLWTLFRVHMTLFVVVMFLTIAAALLGQITSGIVRHSVAVGLQVLCIWALFSLTSPVLGWVF